MAKRKTAIDKAIENVDQKIADHHADIKALELARAHLVAQQNEQRGHPEGGRGI
jgi:hypothetical protein